MLTIDRLFHENETLLNSRSSRGCYGKKNQIDESRIEIEFTHMSSQFEKYLYNKAVWGLTL